MPIIIYACTNFFAEAVPKRILELMNVPGLTRENVASHLQVQFCTSSDIFWIGLAILKILDLQMIPSLITFINHLLNMVHTFIIHIVIRFLNISSHVQLMQKM